MIFLSLLPFALWESCRWATVPAVTIISFLLLGGWADRQQCCVHK